MAEKKQTLNLKMYAGVLFPDDSVQTSALLSGSPGQLTQTQMPPVIDPTGTLTQIDLGVF